MLKIGVFDSGLGGLNLLGSLNEMMNGVTFYYYGDNDNAPYGNCSILRLKSLVFGCVDHLILQGLDGIVIGCNTVSTSLLSEVRSWLNIPVFGVFPPVETPLINGEKTLLLCTERTARIYQKFSDLSICVLNGVVDEIEKFYNDIYHCNKQNYKSRPQIESTPLLNSLLEDKKGVYDTVIFGCTHYFFQKIGIVDHLLPRRLLDGVDFTAKYVSNYYYTKNHKENTNENDFVFLGNNSYVNQRVFFDVVLSGKNTKKITKKSNFFSKSG